MRISSLVCIITLLFSSYQNSNADEMGRAPLRLTITPNPQTVKPSEQEVIRRIIEENQGLNSVLRPRSRPASLAIPVHREGFLKPGEVYRNPPGLPGGGVHLFARPCQGFIEPDGSIGPWGTAMLDAMREVDSRPGTTCFIRDIQFGSKCPNYVNLSQSQKDHVWAWFWAALAQDESSCREKITAQGVWNEEFDRYNTATGLFQMEDRTETRNQAKRDKDFCPDYTKDNPVDVQSIRFQARCSASILSKKQCGGNIQNSGSYWHGLICDNCRTVWSLLARHPLCGG